MTSDVLLWAVFGVLCLAVPAIAYAGWMLSTPWVQVGLTTENEPIITKFDIGTRLRKCTSGSRPATSTASSNASSARYDRLGYSRRVSTRWKFRYARDGVGPR